MCSCISFSILCGEGEVESLHVALAVFGAHYVEQAGLSLTECWDERRAPPCLAILNCVEIAKL